MEKLEKILTPRTGHTQVRFITIKERLDEKIKDKDLRKKLIYCGAIKFEKKKALPKDRELWGLVKNNLDSLYIDDNKLATRIVKQMKKNKNLMPKYLVELLLNDSRFPQRKFSTLQNKLLGIDEKQLRRILVFAGALCFYGQEGEVWGLAKRNLDVLGFSKKDVPKKILTKMETKSSLMPYHLAELTLEHPLFYRRTFTAIKNKLGGFSDKEIRQILKGINAVRFKDKQGNEYWGLKRRNKTVLKRLA